jgi:hypothetical protein
VELEQIDRIGKRPARDDNLVMLLQLADHHREEIDVRRV